MASVKDDIKLDSDELSCALKMVWGWLQMAVITLATKMASSCENDIWMGSHDDNKLCVRIGKFR
eukprot:11688191-Ditylum_brightwellii.AAC.1